MKPDWSVMQAFENGTQIEQRARRGGAWNLQANPTWNWEMYEYRKRVNHYKETVSYMHDNGIPFAIINFGCQQDRNNPEAKKILYDSHIRRSLQEYMEVNESYKFILIPADEQAEEYTYFLIDKIKERKQEKIDARLGIQ